MRRAQCEPEHGPQGLIFTLAFGLGPKVKMLFIHKIEKKEKQANNRTGIGKYDIFWQDSGAKSTRYDCKSDQERSKPDKRYTSQVKRARGRRDGVITTTKRLPCQKTTSRTASERSP